ncbi:DUF2716 domain-containing protein [Listeria rocourtiae]|uniref:DUF2716 domain-containing protein n=1 Tax=Listeria rocourtiae TaxID=647910 RepID=UPI003D2F652D
MVEIKDYQLLSGEEREFLWEELRRKLKITIEYQNVRVGHDITYKEYPLKVGCIDYIYGDDDDNLAQCYLESSEFMAHFFETYFSDGLYVLEREHECYYFDTFTSFPPVDDEGVWRVNFIPESDTSIFVSRRLDQAWISNFKEKSIIVVGEKLIRYIDNNDIFDFLKMG